MSHMQCTKSQKRPDYSVHYHLSWHLTTIDGQLGFFDASLKLTRRIKSARDITVVKEFLIAAHANKGAEVKSLVLMGISILCDGFSEIDTAATDVPLEVLPNNNESASPAA